jgi:hypothetical protein
MARNLDRDLSRFEADAVGDDLLRGCGTRCGQRRAGAQRRRKEIAAVEDAFGFENSPDIRIEFEFHCSLLEKRDRRHQAS